MKSLEGEVALVTGASRGIGAAIASKLSAQGAFVIGTATTGAGAEAVSGLLASSPAGGTGAVLDVADSHSVSALFALLTEQDRAPGIIVNNAGITRDNLLARMSDEEWDAVIDTDLTSIYRICRAAIRHLMKRRCGRIVNVTSVVGFSGNPGQSNYAAAKAGMVGFTRALAREVGARGITVNAVAPGFVDTDMTRELPQAAREKMLEQIPLKRLGGVAEIANAVAFLVGPDAGYITGETLHVNGGMYMG